MNPSFGRLVPKNRDHEIKYSLSKLNFSIPKTIEKNLLFPYSLRAYYDQKEQNSCVAFSWSWAQSMKNNNPLQKYDAFWLYLQALFNDNDPNTNIQDDTGTYVWSGAWVLQHLGHKKPKEINPDLKDGIISYYWGKTADDARTAISLGRAYVTGFNWYEQFMIPEYIKGEWWIGRKGVRLGSVLGGHATCHYKVSDKRQAVGLTSSWGYNYPLVWLPYERLNQLISEDGELVIAIDNPLNT